MPGLLLLDRSGFSSASLVKPGTLLFMACCVTPEGDRLFSIMAVVIRYFVAAVLFETDTSMVEIFHKAPPRGATWTRLCIHVRKERLQYLSASHETLRVWSLHQQRNMLQSIYSVIIISIITIHTRIWTEPLATAGCISSPTWFRLNLSVFGELAIFTWGVIIWLTFFSSRLKLWNGVVDATDAMGLKSTSFLAVSRSRRQRQTQPGSNLFWLSQLNRQIALVDRQWQRCSATLSYSKCYKL